MAPPPSPPWLPIPLRGTALPQSELKVSTELFPISSLTSAPITFWFTLPSDVGLVAALLLSQAFFFLICVSFFLGIPSLASPWFMTASPDLLKCQGRPYLTATLNMPSTLHPVFSLNIVPPSLHYLFHTCKSLYTVEHTISFISLICLSLLEWKTPGKLEFVSGSFTFASQKLK